MLTLLKSLAVGMAQLTQQGSSWVPSYPSQHLRLDPGPAQIKLYLRFLSPRHEPWGEKMAMCQREVEGQTLVYNITDLPMQSPVNV